MTHRTGWIYFSSILMMNDFTNAAGSVFDVSSQLDGMAEDVASVVAVVPAGVSR